MNTTAEATITDVATTTGLSEEQLRDIHIALVEESDADVEAADITPEMNLRDDLAMDSMQAVSMVLDLEDMLEISLDGDEISGIQTVGDLHALLETKLAAKAAG